MLHTPVLYIIIYEVNCTPGRSGLEGTFSPGCTLSVQYCVTWLGAKQRARANCRTCGVTA